MTDSPHADPQRSAADGIAGAINDLTEETRSLVRTEIDQARREMWDKARGAGPGVALAGAAGVLAAFAAASSYRAVTRLLERRLSPGVAAVIATIGYAAGAMATAAAAARRLREAPAPFPTETVRTAAATVGEAADRVRGS